MATLAVGSEEALPELEAVTAVVDQLAAAVLEAILAAVAKEETALFRQGLAAAAAVAAEVEPPTSQYVDVLAAAEA